MKPAANSEEGILRFAFDHEDANSVATARREDLVFEGLQGDLEIVADWTADSQRSDYKALDGRLLVKAVVIIPVLDELIEVCRQLEHRRADLPRVVLHGTPLELAFSPRDDTVVVSIVEAIGYSDNERVLGTIALSIPSLLRVVSGLIRNVVRDILSANPGLHDSPVVRSLLADSDIVEHKSSSA